MKKIANRGGSGPKVEVLSKQIWPNDLQNSLTFQAPCGSFDQGLWCSSIPALWLISQDTWAMIFERA